MNQNSIAMVFSSIAVAISLAGIVWSIYERVFLKPFSRVTGYLGYIDHLGEKMGPYITMKITNKGPGRIIISNIVAQEKRSLKQRLNKELYKMTIIYDYTNPYNIRIPATIEQYDTMYQQLPYEKDCSLSSNLRKLGFLDSLGRSLWMKKKNLREISKKYKQEFS